ncbi:Sterol uptake protein 2 [Cyberlindnera fabianii]|uniref:Sterol uptake protein 2 n=1 Tax=Cyberlindnera fabianii TaxID=36022 RepID=A0A1V2LBH5_CYBFA|nr:Sterol uptake protein 2 [Cyberlindnera fabianii]
MSMNNLVNIQPAPPTQSTSPKLGKQMSKSTPIVVSTPTVTLAPGPTPGPTSRSKPSKITKPQGRPHTRPRSRKVQQHITGKSSRQRVGPSCDMCRRKKIKCDAYIEVVEQDVDEDCVEFDVETSHVLDQSLISRFITQDEKDDGFKMLFSNGKLIKFRNCSFCEAKGVEATYERGYTKEDTVLHTVLDTMNKKIKRRLS